jgi:hypothetical protein
MTPMRIITRTLTAAALAAATASCGSVVRSGSAPVFLVVDLLTATRGSATSGTAASNLTSDVLTLVTSGGACTTANPCPTVFNDTGSITLRLAPKDIGLPGAATVPSSNNEVTISRVHISYRRTDGRNREGVDVPFAYDTASTGTVPATGTMQLGFEIVRVQAKEESPLVQLVSSGQTLSMICDVTVYGQDRVGNAISATGSIGVEFGNFGDE